MKICDLTQFYSPVSGGVRRYVEQKVRHVIEHSDTNEHILVIPGATNACETRGRAKIYTIASPLISKTSRYRALFNLNLVEEVLEREKPDIIESGDPYQLAWKAIASGRALSIPVVGFYHSHFPEAYIRSVAKYFGKLSVIIADDVSRRYVKALYNRLERTFVPSPALAALLGEWGVENVANIDLGVETGIFYPNKDAGRIVRQQLGVPEDRILLLYVGRLAQEKNVRTLLEAFQMLHASQPNRYVLLTIGDGALRQSVLRLKETTQAVHWLSYCGNAKELADYYRAADLFVHPSVNETFGLVTIESQASGTPVVGIRGSYMDRIIFSPQTHWAPENTPEALATAVQMISQQDLRAVGLAASQEVRQRYSWDGVFSRLFSIYQEVIDGYIN